MKGVIPVDGKISVVLTTETCYIGLISESRTDQGTSNMFVWALACEMMVDNKVLTTKIIQVFDQLIIL